MQRRVVPLLEEFIWSLDSEERSKLKPLKFKGRKRSLLIALLKQPDRANEKRPRYASSPQLNKIRSELLAYCYDAVVPEGGSTLLKFLVDRGLYRHFAKEVQQQEKEVLARHNAHETESFYFEVIRLLPMVPILASADGVVWNTLKKYPLKYIRSKQVPEKDDEYYPVIFELAFAMRNALRSPHKARDVRKVEKTLLMYDKKLGNSNNGLVATTLIRRILIFYRVVLPTTKKLRQYYQKEIEYYQTHPQARKFTIQGSVDFLPAEFAYFQMDVQTAFDLFNDLYRRTQKSVKTWSVYHSQLFVILCQSLQKYDLAEAILEERFRRFIDFYQSPHTILSTVYFTRHYILTEQFDKAQKMLQIGLEKNTGPLFDKIHQLNLRMSKVVLALIRKDYYYVHTLCTSALSLCSRRGYTLKKSKIPHFFKICDAIADAASMGEMPSKDSIEKIAIFTFPFDFPAAALRLVLQRLYGNEKANFLLT